MRVPCCPPSTWSSYLHHVRLNVYVCNEALCVEHDCRDVLPACYKHLRQVQLRIGREQCHHALVVCWCVCAIELLNKLDLVQNVCWRITRQHHQIAASCKKPSKEVCRTSGTRVTGVQAVQRCRGIGQITGAG
jgi:hypothetical protein